MGEKEYQFGFGDANHPDRNLSLSLELTYATTDPTPHPGIQKYSLDGGYTISMHVRFDNWCLDNATGEPIGLKMDAAGCSLLRYALPDWNKFLCAGRRFKHSDEPWRHDPNNSHQFINLHEMPGYSEFKDSTDLNVCGTACKDAGYPLMEMGRVSMQRESMCKCFRVLTHSGEYALSNCPITSLYSMGAWFFSPDFMTVGIGVRNGKIYFGDNAQTKKWDCSHLPLPVVPNVHPCLLTNPVALLTVNDDYNDGNFHHVVAEYSPSLEKMRLAVSRSDGSGYEVVEQQVARDSFTGYRESYTSRWIHDWATNPYPGNGHVELDDGAWTMNAGGNAGHAGVNMHSVRAFEGVVMDQLLDETETPPPQPATHQDQCDCILQTPPAAPPPPPH